MKKLQVAFLFLTVIVIVSACDLDFDGDDLVGVTASPPYSITQADISRCAGTYTGITIQLPDEDWGCQVKMDDEKSETILVDSSLFHVIITTIKRDPYCPAAQRDPSCLQTPFYENKRVSLSTWSSFGVIKEIYGITRITVGGVGVPIYISIKYDGMDRRRLTADEHQELANFLDSISFGK